jgi:DNA invertase Pin-like site-specific DNA recombinase
LTLVLKKLIKKRSIAGLAATQKRGVVFARRQKLSRKEQKMLIESYKSGVPIKELKKLFGISKTYLYNCLQIHNISLKINKK